MTKDSVLSAHQVEQVQRFEAQEEAPFTILIHATATAATKSAPPETVRQ
jgi:adenylate cyclase